MTSWKTTPLLKAFLPFIAGFLLALNFNQLHISTIPMWIIWLLAIILLFISNVNKKFKSAIIYILLFTLGIYTINQHQTDASDTFSPYIQPRNQLLAKVISTPISKEKTKFIAKIIAIAEHEKMITTSTNVQVYLETSLDTSQIEYGDLLAIEGQIQPFSSPKNPNSFDYQSFMKNRGVFAQIYVKEKDWKIFKKGGWSIFKTTNILRRKFKQLLEKYLTTPRERSVGLALILGYKSELSKEIKTQYAITGAMHILAVSGLHVGLVYLLLHFLLRNFKATSKVRQYIKIGINLLGIWSFVLISGASVSVVRAGIMFSFIILGKMLSLKTNTYNSIIASMFFILVLDPMQIKTVGFQLSYLAVLSIIWLHPKIKKLVTFDNIFMAYIWELTAISIAAQILVLPLGIYYFHQFPVYFWLSSWFVIPLATIILYLGILLFILSYIFTPITTAIGFVLYWALWILNSIVFLIQQIPFNHIGNIWIEKAELLVIYCIIFLALKAFTFKKLKILNWSFSILVLFLCFSIFQKIYAHKNNFTIIYHVPNQTIIDTKIGNKGYSISNADANDEQYSTQGNRMKNHYSIVQHEPKDTIVQTKNYLHYRNFIFTEKNAFFILGEDGIIPKYQPIIVTNNRNIDFSSTTTNPKDLLLIVDASNHPLQNHAWELYANIDSLQIYNVTTFGAYIGQ